MPQLTRRTALKSLSLAAIAAALPAGAGDPVFPRVAPADEGADPGKIADLLAFIDAEIAAGSMPGALLVAARHGRIFAEHYAGTYRDANGADNPVSAAAAHPLFSFSKGIAGTVAALVKQDGLIDFDGPVSRYIPEYTGGGKEGTTVQHLLTHAAGIPGESHGPVEAEEQWNAYLAQLCAAEAVWKPGERTGYHGLSGMFLVAEIIRRVLDRQPWETICRERLFDPIGARFTFAPESAGGPVAVAPGYFESIAPGKNGIGAHPAGGVFGTPEDMLRLLQMIVQGGTWNGRAVLQPETWAELLTAQYADQIAGAVAAGRAPAHEPWGIGWLVRGAAPRCDGGPWFGFGDGTSPTLFGHAGVDTVFGVGDPARDLAFVFLMTAKLKDAAESTRIRREVSNRLQAALIA